MGATTAATIAVSDNGITGASWAHQCGIRIDAFWGSSFTGVKMGQCKSGREQHRLERRQRCTEIGQFDFGDAQFTKVACASVGQLFVAMCTCSEPWPGPGAGAGGKR